MGNSTDPIRVVQLVQQQYKQVGINLNMQALDAGPLFNTVLPHRQFEIALFSWARAAFLNQAEIPFTNPLTFLLKQMAIRVRTTAVSVTPRQTL